MSSTVLILSASYGNGHHQAAKSIEDEFYRQGINKVVFSDLYAESYPIAATITRSLLFKGFKYGSPVYKAFYYGTDKFSHTGLSYFLQHLGRSRVKELIHLHHPQCIITTFPLLAAPYLRNKDHYSIPTYTVITDYCLHSLWVHPYIDKYFAASVNVKEKLLKHGVSEDKIVISGIPIRSNFEKKVSKDYIYKKYHLRQDAKIVTVLAGASGLLKNTDKICEGLLKLKEAQIIVICGNNDTLYQKLFPLQTVYGDKIRLLQYVEDIHEIFEVSYCMITKPGGISITEAASKETPLILYKPIPGQEKENAQFFEESGAGKIANNVKETINAVEELIHNEEKQKAMKMALKDIYQPHSSKIIVKEIIKDCFQYEHTN